MLPPKSRDVVEIFMELWEVRELKESLFLLLLLFEFCIFVLFYILLLFLSLHKVIREQFRKLETLTE